MADSDAPKCPFPGDSDQPLGHDPAACPVPHGDPSGPEWDVETHVEAIRRAREKALSSHLGTDHAEAMAVKVTEQRATQKGLGEIRSEFLDSLGKKLGYGHPLSDRTGIAEFTWTPEAEARLTEVPAFCRELTRWRVEWTALKKNLGTTITPEIMAVKYQMWGEVSHAIEARRGREMEWTDSAKTRFEKVPEFVRGQVLEAVEGNARNMGCQVIDDEVVDKVVGRWSTSGDFHEGLYGFR